MRNLKVEKAAMEIALAALECDHEFFESMPEQNAAVAFKLLDLREGWVVVKHPEKFKGLNFGKFARALIERGLYENFVSGESSMTEFADLLLRSGNQGIIADNPELFDVIDLAEVYLPDRVEL